MVDDLIKDKENSRRRMLEQAAGISIYKTRKKEAEKRLFETEDNLNRVQDIIYELEAQLHPLREQSEIAAKYLVYKEQLTTVDVNVTIQEIESHKKVWEEQDKVLKIIIANIEDKKRSLFLQEETQKK